MKKNVNLLETLVGYTGVGSVVGGGVNVLLSRAGILTHFNDFEYILSVGMGALAGCIVGAFRHAHLVQRAQHEQLEKERLDYEKNIPGSGFKDESWNVPPYKVTSRGNKVERSLEEGVMLARIGADINITKPNVQYRLARQLSEHRKARQEAWAKCDFDFDKRVDEAYDKEQARQQAKWDLEREMKKARQARLVSQGYLRCSCTDVFRPEDAFISPESGRKYCESSCYKAAEW